MNNPIDNIEWLDAEDLDPSNWNPNVVFNQELRLLEHSILTTGWIQPILINRDNVIIDGFHRWRLAQDSKAMRAAYQGKVPCARLDIGDAEAKMMTVRVNRAKGTHTAVKMAELVQALIDEHGLDPAHIARGLGATADEVSLLYTNSIFKQRNLSNYKYSKAWVPKEKPREVEG